MANVLFYDLDRMLETKVTADPLAGAKHPRSHLTPIHGGTEHSSSRRSQVLSLEREVTAHPDCPGARGKNLRRASIEPPERKEGN